MTALFTKKNALLDTFAPKYLESCIIRLGEPKIKESLRGKFEKLEYSLGGYDISKLSLEEKLSVLSILYHLDVDHSGKKQAATNLENLVKTTKDRLGVVKEFDEIVQQFPEGLFESEKLKYLSREDLESTCIQYLSEVQEARDALDTSVTERTVDLAAEKDILEATINNTSDGVFALNRGGKIITFNRKMEDLTGFTLNEAIDKSAEEVVRLFDDTIPIEIEKYNPLVEKGADKNIYSNNKVILIAKDGSKKFVRMISAVISEGKDINLGCIVTLTDVTKELELETMKLDFVSIAAHELRTPLTSIRGYLELLNGNIADSIDETSLNYLKKVIVSADQLYILIENLLNISRIEKGNLVVNKEPADWPPLVNSVIARFTESSADAQVKLDFANPNSEIPKVLVDTTMIGEVLSNLIDNAIKYNKLGGRVTIVIEVADNTVVTHIKDTGVGIPQESLPHLFKKFYRTSTSVLTQGKKGTGLGLFISRQIVKLHGGVIWVKSEEGKGTTFSFSLPIAP